MEGEEDEQVATDPELKTAKEPVPPSGPPSVPHITQVASISDQDWLHDHDLEEALHGQKAKASASWSVFFGLTYTSIGVVYGDLGTSPMYLWQTCFSFPATKSDIIGALSLILWTLSLIVVVKYVAIVLCANDQGEGGTFAIYSLLCRHAKITPFGLHHESDKGLSQYNKETSSKRGGRLRRKLAAALESSPLLQNVLLTFVLFGTCALVGDGVMTPPVEILSAMTGLQVPAVLLNADGSTKISNGVVIGATCAIMIGVFVSQRFGTSKIGLVYAPILVAFFIVNAVIGIYNISKWEPSIFKAFLPSYGIEYLVRNKFNGWKSLGGICLAITGVEALFADLGHFNVASIRTSSMFLVYPSLLLIYLGQGAYLSQNPGDVSQAYFKAIPTPVYWPVFVLATLATIVASQAIITGTFSVIAQSARLHCFPRVKVVHTSQVVEGQIYIPEVNWVLMILGLACVLGFCLPQPSNRPVNGEALGNAFGIAVMSVMVITTCLVTLVMVLVWNVRLWLAATFFGFFFVFEMIILSANVYKVTHGGWFPIVIAVVVFAISYIWHWGSTQRNLHSSKLGCQLEDVIVPENESQYADPYAAQPASSEPLQLCLKSSGHRISVARGAALFYCDTLQHLPPIFSFSLHALPTVHEIMVFLTIRQVPVPHVLPKERLLVKPLAYPGFYWVVARYGYLDQPNHSASFAQQVLRTIAHYLEYGSSSPDLQSRLSFDGADPTWSLSRAASRKLAPFGASRNGATAKALESALKAVEASSGKPDPALPAIGELSPKPETATHNPSSESSEGEGPSIDDEIADEWSVEVSDYARQLKLLKAAERERVLYLKTRSVLRAAKGSTLLRKFVLESAYNALLNLSRSPAHILNIPYSQLLELAIVYEL